MLLNHRAFPYKQWARVRRDMRRGFTFLHCQILMALVMECRPIADESRGLEMSCPVTILESLALAIKVYSRHNC